MALEFGVRNSQLVPGARINWRQFSSKTARGREPGRPRAGAFWSLAPGSFAIWVKPDHQEPGEPVAIKVYRRVRSGAVEALAYDNDLTADAA